MAKLDTGNGSPNAVLNGTINFLESGGTLGRLLQGSIFGILVSVATGGVNLVQSIFGLVVAPLDAAASVVSEFFVATVLGPLPPPGAPSQASSARSRCSLGSG